MVPYQDSYCHNFAVQAMATPARNGLHWLKHGGFLIKGLSWIIALLGLWEFGDIAALFVPGFGSLPAYLWNHIIVGMVLMVAGITAARTNNAGTARTMSWMAVIAGIWLITGTLMLRHPVTGIGSLNDIIVGVSVVVLGAWAALTSPRASG